MPLWLKQSTASQEIPLGYFVDSTDGDTEETALTINNTDIKLWKNGATTLANKNSGGATHISNGVYHCTLDATDTNTLGPLVIFVHVSGALTVRVECLVVAANVFDSLIGGGDTLLVDVSGWNGISLSTTNPLPNAAAGAAGGLPTDSTGKTAFNDLSAAQVNTEVDTALADIDLDHLWSNGTAVPAVAAGSIFDQIMDDGTAVYDRTTDSLQAVRDRGDSAWTTGAGGSDRLLMVDTTIATLATQTSFTLTSGSADNDAYNNCTIVVEDAATSTQKAVGMVLDYVGATKTVTLKEALAFTIATTDKVYILAENSLKSTVANRQLDVSANGNAGIDWANVENPATAVDLSATDIQLCDTVTTNTDMRGTDSAALASVCTEGRLSELDAANIPADVDAILLDTNELQTDNVPGLIAALNDPTAAAIADAVWDETTAGHVTAGTFGEQVKTDIDAILVDTADMQPKIGTPAADVSADIAAVKTQTAAIETDTQDIQARLPSTRMADDVTFTAGTTTTATLGNVDGSAASAVDDQYNGRILIFNNGTLDKVVTDITDYNGTTKVATITAVPTAVLNTHTAIMA